MLRGHDWSTVGVIGGISNIMAVVAAVVVGKTTTYACVCVCVSFNFSISVYMRGSYWTCCQGYSLASYVFAGTVVVVIVVVVGGTVAVVVVVVVGGEGGE